MSTRICFDLLTDGDTYRVGVWVNGVPVWHDGETALEAFRKAVESVMPVSEPSGDLP